MNPIQKQGWKSIETIFAEDIIEGDDVNSILDLFEECTYFQCGECFTNHGSMEDAEECCTGEDED